MTSNADYILEIGSVLVGYTDGVANLAKNPTGADQASALAGLAGVLISAVGTVDSPFLKALSSATGGKLAVSSMVIAGIQLNQAWNDFQSARAGSSTVDVAYAQRNLLDKTLGVFSAIGGTMAAIPVPQIKSIGLLIWGASTFAQQWYNGNAARALEIVGTEVAELIKSTMGGHGIDIHQTRDGQSEIITSVFRDAYGIPRGSYGKVQEGSKISSTSVSVTGGWIVDIYDAQRNHLMTYFRPDGQDINIEKIILPREDWERALTAAAHAPRYEMGFSNQQGNTVEYAQQLLNVAGISTPLADYLLPGSLSHEFSLNATLLAEDWTQNHLTGTNMSPMRSDWENNILDLDILLGSSNNGTFINLFNAGLFTDPIIVDLDGDGLSISNKISEGRGVLFDLTSDGQVERTSWIGPGDAFLVRDKNTDGQISDLTEMFAGATPGDSYELLRAFDQDSSNSISASEAIVANISLWRDTNQDGETQSGELLSFDDAGIASLSLAYRTSGHIAGDGFITHFSSAIRSDGSSVSVADAFLFHQANPFTDPAT